MRTLRHPDFMKLRHILQLTVRRILPAAVLILICIATALFAGGYYTFSFLQGENNILPPSFFSPLGDVDTEDAGDTLAPGDKEKPIDIVLPDDKPPQNASSRSHDADERGLLPLHGGFHTPYHPVRSGGGI